RLGSNDVAGVNAWLAAEVTPVQVINTRATALALTPTAAPLAALEQDDRITQKQNVLTADTGEITLQYAKSPIQESDEIAAAILALTP
ncbi:MAG: hypothetical protein PHO41_11945, partial [Eubacteriales bacterium]|nr:hypothetical protein [Eubacteriales bacterium]